MAPSVGVEAIPINVRDPAEIERTLATFARSSNGGLIVTGSALATSHRDLIVGLAAQYKLPSVYYERLFVTGGGLISYGPDLADPIPPCGRLCGPNPPRRKSGRLASAGTSEVRVGPQS